MPPEPCLRISSLRGGVARRLAPAPRGELGGDMSIDMLGLRGRWLPPRPSPGAAFKSRTLPPFAPPPLLLDRSSPSRLSRERSSAILASLPPRLSTEPARSSLVGDSDFERSDKPGRPPELDAERSSLAEARRPCFWGGRTNCFNEHKPAWVV